VRFTKKFNIPKRIQLGKFSIIDALWLSPKASEIEPARLETVPALHGTEPETSESKTKAAGSATSDCESPLPDAGPGLG